MSRPLDAREWLKDFGPKVRASAHRALAGASGFRVTGQRVRALDAPTAARLAGPDAHCHLDDQWLADRLMTRRLAREFDGILTRFDTQRVAAVALIEPDTLPVDFTNRIGHFDALDDVFRALRTRPAAFDVVIDSLTLGAQRRLHSEAAEQRNA